MGSKLTTSGATNSGDLLHILHLGLMNLFKLSDLLKSLSLGLLSDPEDFLQPLLVAPEVVQLLAVPLPLSRSLREPVEASLRRVARTNQNNIATACSLSFS